MTVGAISAFIICLSGVLGLTSIHSSAFGVLTTTITYRLGQLMVSGALLLVVWKEKPVTADIPPASNVNLKVVSEPMDRQRSGTDPTKDPETLFQSML